MVGLSSILSIHSHNSFYDYKATNLKASFAYKFQFQTTDYNIINKYVIHKFNLYIAANNKDFSL